MLPFYLFCPELIWVTNSASSVALKFYWLVPLS
jgi:hypothetical protein